MRVISERFPRLALTGLLLSSLSASAACDRSEDCKLFNTCPGSLLESAKTLAGKNASACLQCLQQHCADTAESCSQDIACNFASRCKLAASPPAYQKCLRDLYEGGFTRGYEERFPWEGEDSGAFGTCLQDHCRADCIGDPFECDEGYAEYRNLQIEVALRDYPFFERLEGIKIKACRDFPGPSATLEEESRECTRWRTTDRFGRASFPRTFENVRAERLYFEIEEKKGVFPRTFYYPGRLGDGHLQLLTIYVILGQLIEAGNNALGRGYGILEDVGQSVILSDSCVWEEISVGGLTVSVEDAELPRCDGTPCHGAACTPCVWYAKDKFPDTDARQTDGTGAGIVGLKPGFYAIRVERGEPEPVALREDIRMQGGALTIVRTWPLDLSSRRSNARPTSTATP